MSEATARASWYPKGCTLAQSASPAPPSFTCFALLLPLTPTPLPLRLGTDDDPRPRQCMVSFPHPEYRFILPIAIADHSGMEWVTMFNDTAVQLLGATAGDMLAMKEDPDNGSRAWTALVLAARFTTLVFRIRVKVREVVVCQSGRSRVTVVGTVHHDSGRRRVIFCIFLRPLPDACAHRWREGGGAAISGCSRQRRVPGTAWLTYGCVACRCHGGTTDGSRPRGDQGPRHRGRRQDH